MSFAVALLWLGTAAAQASRQPALDGWARARLVALARPRPGLPALPAYDAAVVERIEDRLDAATIAIASLDDAGAQARLGEARLLLDANPALPQAAFLMAEWLHTAADVAARGGDAVRARALVEQARAIEGTRATVYSTAGDADVGPPPPAAPPRLLVSGLEPGDTLYWDGVVATDRVPAAAGRHDARVVRRGRAVWATWVDVAPAATRVPLALPRAVPCSLDDIGGARVTGNAVAAPAGTRCARWAVARAAPDGSVEVASCYEASCGPLLVWHRDDGAAWSGQPQPAPDKAGWPGWATYLLTGVGLTAATTFTMWRSGVFDHPTPPRTTFRYYGP